MKHQGIGEVTADQIVSFFETYGEVVEEMEAILEIQEKAVGTKGHPNINGKTFVITGTLNDYSRDDLVSLIETQGGKVSGAVSSRTDYLIAGEKAGSKLDKATKLGIRIINENAIKALLGG